MQTRSDKTNHLFESLRSARTKYPDTPAQFFEKFVQADKSGTYKFVEKMCQFYNEGYNILAICSTMEKYQKLETFVENKDITHKTYDDVVSDIEDAELKKLNSYNERKQRSLLNGLIFNKNNIRVYSITDFNQSFEKGKGTKWCTSLDEDKFSFYIKQYNIYIIVDLNQDIDSPFRKVCYLNAGVEDMFVDRNNIHYFESDKTYDELKSYYGKDLMKIME